MLLLPTPSAAAVKLACEPRTGRPDGEFPSFSRRLVRSKIRQMGLGPCATGYGGPGRRRLTRSKLRRIDGWRKIAAMLTKGQGEERW